MTQIYYKSLVLYVYGKPVKGTGFNVFEGAGNVGAQCGMDDFGNGIPWCLGYLAYGF